MKPYLDLYEELVYRTAVQRGQEIVSYEDIDVEMDRETDNYGAGIDRTTGIFMFRIKVAKDNFLKGLQYLNEGMTKQVFTVERIQHHVTSFNNSFSERMKSPGIVLDLLMMPMLLKNNSYELLHDLVNMHKLRTTIDQDIKDEEARNTLDKFRRITEFMTNPQRVMFFIGGDIKSIADSLKKDQRKDLEAVLDEYIGEGVFGGSMLLMKGLQ